AQRKMLDEQPDSGKKHRMQTASDKRLFYSSPYNLKTKYNAVIHLLDSKNFDGMVMDVKDDRGFILYNSRLKLAHEIGAVRPVFDLPKIIQLVHEKNKYLAVRIVVFKDPVLFENHPYAIWDKTGDFPWTGNPKERWLDPYNPALADKYYVPLIEELTALGVDEIQLDYIRFPSDGLIGNCLFRYKKGDKSFSEAIEDFLVKIRQATPLPLSLDIYGYQGLYRTGGAIGQDMEVLGKYADVISPMLYSSHFGDLYLTDIEKDKRVYRLIRHSISRAEFISRNRFLIRPYLQAFPMKSAIWGYGEKYFTDQIRANVDERGSGYSFWGSIENMQALDNSLNHRQ
ncbi:MAG: putative glycoside hydrolase, partial [Spirochaetia bacterium]|nr:putative glycoside hydrolase [Spirochaetia bacterium]